MSISVLKRELELLNGDLKVKVSGQMKSTKKASVIHQIGTNKQEVRKQIRQLKAHSTGPKNKATVKDKQTRNAIEEYRKKLKKNQLDSNLQYFLGTSYKMPAVCTQKIVKQNGGRQSRAHPGNSVKKEEKQSIFTEAEFQKFQEEYFSKL